MSSSSSSSRPVSHMEVIKSEQFSHKICGMHSKMINAFRLNMNDPTNLNSTFQLMINNLEKRIQKGLKLDNPVSVGFTFGNVAHVLLHHNLNLEVNDIVICFILDTMDI